MTRRRQRLHALNRIIWIALFLMVAAMLAWAEWQDSGQPGIGWFLAASLWSAVCGIGYSACDWLLRDRLLDRSPEPLESDEPRLRETGGR